MAKQEKGINMSIKSRIYNILPGVKIIGMHHMCDAPDELCDCVISKANFERFISGKSFVTLEEAITHPASNNGSYCITIDDGLADLYDIYLLTKEKNIPIAAFVSSSLVGQPGYISEKQLKTMTNDPLVTIGSHGRTHIKLTECDDAKVRNEMCLSREELFAIVGTRTKFFAYPNGAFSAREEKMLKNAGYTYAMSVIPRKNTIVTKMMMPYAIPRYNLTNETFKEEVD